MIKQKLSWIEVTCVTMNIEMSQIILKGGLNNVLIKTLKSFWLDEIFHKVVYCKRFKNKALERASNNTKYNLTKTSLKNSV